MCQACEFFKFKSDNNVFEINKLGNLSTSMRKKNVYWKELSYKRHWINIDSDIISEQSYLYTSMILTKKP